MNQVFFFRLPIIITFATLPKVQQLIMPLRLHHATASLPTSTTPLVSLWQHRCLPALSWRCAYQMLSCVRFQSVSTADRARCDEALREELLKNLVDRRLFGPSQQILQLDPGRLPKRELPPGNVASLFLMFLGYIRASGLPPASKSTFYKVARQWGQCLVFRRRSDHTMCAECQRLKTAIHHTSDLSLVVC